MDTLVAVSTITHKSVNQDRCAVFRNGARMGVVVADGVGSQFGAEIGATLACEAACRDLANGTGLQATFKAARDAVRAWAVDHEGDLPREAKPGEAFGTTLLTAFIETDDLVFAWLGNGGLFHVRTDFCNFPPGRLVPWTALNYLIPHSTPQGDQPLLNKLISPSLGDAQVLPSVVRASRDYPVGDILVAVTDGIYSPDQLDAGRDPEARIWADAGAGIQLLWKHLRQFLKLKRFTSSALKDSLDTYLAELASKGLVSDDCTLGVVITPEALAYATAAISKGE